MYSASSHRTAVLLAHPNARAARVHDPQAQSQQQTDSRGVEAPVDQVICVVPPFDRVEVEPVPGDIDRERQPEQDVGCDREREATRSSEDPPAGGQDEERDRAHDRAADEGLPGELRQIRVQHRPGEQADRRDLIATSTATNRRSTDCGTEIPVIGRGVIEIAFGPSRVTTDVGTGGRTGSPSIGTSHVPDDPERPFLRQSQHVGLRARSP